MVQNQSQKTTKRDMTKGEIVPHIMRMTLPMTIGIGAIICVSLVDTYFVSLLGSGPLTAMGYAFPVITLFFNMIFGMAIAMSAVVSRKIGAQKTEEVKETVIVGLTSILILTAILAFAFLTISDTLFAAMGADALTRDLIHEYMDIWFIGAIFLGIPVVANSAIRGAGDSVSPAVVMTTIAVVNLILDPILIFGFMGIPAMGLAGAAWATVIAYIAGAVTSLAILWIKEKLIHFYPLLCRESWKRSLKALFIIAIPVSLANIITPLVAYGYTTILSGIGDDAVAGFGVVTRVEAFALIPIMALAGGIAPLIGQNYGAGFSDRVEEAIRKAMKFSIVYGIGCAVFLGVFSYAIAMMFSDDQDIRSFITHYLIYVPISLIGLSIFLVVTSAMNAMEQPKISLVLNIVRAFVLALPLAWLMTVYYGEAGFLWSIIITNALSFIMAVICIKRLDCFQSLKTLI